MAGRLLILTEHGLGLELGPPTTLPPACVALAAVWAALSEPWSADASERPAMAASSALTSNSAHALITDAVRPLGFVMY